METQKEVKCIYVSFPRKAFLITDIVTMAETREQTYKLLTVLSLSMDMEQLSHMVLRILRV